MRLTCYFHEKRKIVRTVTAHSVTFYVHTVAILCNDVDIFMVTCNDVHALALMCNRLLVYPFTNDSLLMSH